MGVGNWAKKKSLHDDEKKQNKPKFPDEEMGGGKVKSSRRSHHPPASADWSARAGWQVGRWGGLSPPGHQLSEISGGEGKKKGIRKKHLERRWRWKWVRGEYGKEEEPEEGVSVGRKQELSQLGIRPAVLSLSDAKFPFKLPRQVVPDR